MKFHLYTIFLFSLITLDSCTDENNYKSMYDNCLTNNQILELKLIHHNDIIKAIYNELDNAYGLFIDLDSVYNLKIYNEDTSGLITLESMLITLDSTLMNSYQIIDSLQDEININFSSAFSYTNIIENLQAKLKEKEYELAIHKELNEELMNQNTNLHHSNDSITEEFNNEKKKLTSELTDLAQRIIKMQYLYESNFNSLKIQMSENYYKQGNELMTLFVNTSPGLFGLKKETKQQQIKLAYTLFFKACELGHKDAAHSINFILNHKEYNKYLKLRPSKSFNINNACGIPPE